MKACKNCVYFDLSGDAALSIDGEQLHSCIRFPPQVMLNKREEQIINRHPDVAPGDWCGEFKDKSVDMIKLMSEKCKHRLECDAWATVFTMTDDSTEQEAPEKSLIKILESRCTYPCPGEKCPLLLLLKKPHAPINTRLNRLKTFFSSNPG